MQLSGYKKTYQESVKKCLAHKELHILKENITDIGGMIEPLPFNKGLIIQITGTGKSQINQIQKSVRQYSIHERKGFSKICQKCTSLYKLIQNKEVTKKVILTEIGATIVIICNTKNCKDIRILDHCDWCVCPTRTASSCTSCCGG